MQGLVLNIQRLSTEDGPGMRTTVFFKGCPLHCAWCHNPESISPRPQVHWLETRCIACHTCLDVCPSAALAAVENGIVIDQSKCDGCGDCSRACPSGALELLGRQYGLDELVGELVKDRAFFEKSDQGGITLSGGEPTLQFDFTLQLLQKLRAQQLHTALDTCGVCKESDLLQLLPLVDLVLYDLKLVDSQAHRFRTGGDNRIILDNLVEGRRITFAPTRVSPACGFVLRSSRAPRRMRVNLTALGEFISAQPGGCGRALGIVRFQQPVP